MRNGLLPIAAGTLLVLGAAAGAIPLLTGGDAPLADGPAAAPVAQMAAAQPAPSTAAGADEGAVREGPAGDDPAGPPPGMARPVFPPATGTTPTAADARSLEELPELRIRSDEGFVPANGVRSGQGTLADPFVISGYHITGDLSIADTGLCFIVKENYIAGQLTLNWNGQCTWVHHNFIGDLRVNENVKRAGYATGGLLELNKIEFIGQLRHYDGEFRNNVVGPYAPESIWDPIMETVPWMFATDPRVANIDGFNQGLIHHNTFHGSVDLDFHGHHHGTGFFAPMSHYHGGNETWREEHGHNHTLRWTSVSFTDNRIIKASEEDYGLRYEDRAHAGDDRTANSETEEDLDLPHRHYTHITIADNSIEGGQLWVDVFNADDDRHYGVNPGWLDLLDNDVRFHERDTSGPLGVPFFGAGTDWHTAFHVTTAKEADITIRGNHVEFVPLPDHDGDVTDIDLWPFDDAPAQMAGITLDGIRAADLVLRDNTVKGFHYGVKAHAFNETAHWLVSGNDFGDAAYPVYYDESVANRPTGTDP